MDVFPEARFQTFPDEASWLAARREGIGSADAAPLLQVSPHCSAYEVFCDKRGIVLPPADPTRADLMVWGRALEGPILDQFAARHDGWEVHRPSRWNSYTSLTWPWLRASLDAIAFRPDRPDPGAVEVKWAPYLDSDDAKRRDYVVQNLHQQLTLGARWGIVIVLARTELVWFDIDPDDTFFAEYVDFTATWWKHVLQGIAPEPDGSPHTRQAIAARFKQPQPGFIRALPHDALLWDAQRQRALEEVKKWQGMADQYQARIMDAIGEAEAGVLDDGTSFTWRVTHRSGYSVAPSEFRVLRRRKGPLDLSALIDSLKPDDGGTL